MNGVKKMFKSYVYVVISLLSLTFIGTLLNYFDVINGRIVWMGNFMAFLFSMGLGGFVIGKDSIKNGWLEGLKMGIGFVLFILLFNVIFIHSLNVKDVVLWVLLVLTSIIGSMVGINKKEK